jgi:2-polyprenyl-6-methoxyphenol hydroxylase-like FAD-dependent oxidoreductase
VLCFEAAEKGGVGIKYGMRCTGIEYESSSCAIANFENGEKVHADLIVGADGVNSRIRPHIHPDVMSEYTGGVFITGSLNRKDVRPFELPSPCVVPGPVGQFALVENGEVVSFFAWVNGQQKVERSGEGWGRRKRS